MTEVVSGEPDLAEVYRYVSPDTVYLQALSGNFAEIDSVADADEQRTILAAARCSGIEVPRDVASRLPSPVSVAREVRGFPNMADLHVAALALGGAHTTAYKVGKGVERTLHAVTVLPEFTLSTASHLATKSGMQPVATLGEMATAIVVAPRALTRLVLNYGSGKLSKAAAAFVSQRYGQYFYEDHRIAPWLWAELLVRAVDHPARTVGALRTIAGGLVGSMEAMGEGGIDIEHAPRPLIQLVDSLRRNRPITTSTRVFAAAEQEARENRETAKANFFKPKPSRRPSGETLASLGRSTRAYNEHVVSPHVTLASSIRQALQDSRLQQSQVATPELAAMWAAATELALVPGQHGDYRALLSRHTADVAAPLLNYAYENSGGLALGHGPLGLVRIVADIGHPSYARLSLLPGAERFYPENEQLVTQLDKAAFNWFDQPFADYSESEAFRRFMREAYLLDRLRLEPMPSRLLAATRASRFLATIPNDRRLARAIPRRVQPLINWANKQVFTYH
jgi:hypothetical protein